MAVHVNQTPFNAESALSDSVLLRLGSDGDIVFHHRVALLAADAEVTGVIVGTSDHQGVAADSLILSNITASGDIMGLVNNGGNSLEWLLVDASAKSLHLGFAMTDVRLYGNVGIGYAGAFGTNAAGVVGIGIGTAPTTAPADMVQAWVADYAVGDARLYIRSEAGTNPVIIGNNRLQLGSGFAELELSGQGIEIAGDTCEIRFTDTTVSQDDFNFYLNSSSLSIRNITDNRNDLSINGVGVLSTGGLVPTVITAVGAIVAAGGIAFTDVLNAWIDDASHGDGTVTHYIGNAPILVGNSVSFGPGGVTSITVVNGQITAIS